MMRKSSDASQVFWRSAVFLASIPQGAGGSLAGSVLTDCLTTETGAWLDGFLRRGLGATYCRYLPDGLRTELTDERWRSMPAQVQSLLQVGAVCAERPGVLFLDLDIARQLPADSLAALSEISGVPFIFVVAPSVDVPLVADHYLVADGDALVGLGSHAWFDSHRKAIAAELAAHVQARAETGVDVFDEMIEDM
jgi:hypothetical protein